MIEKVYLFLYLLSNKYHLNFCFFEEDEFSVEKITSIGYYPIEGRYIEIKNKKQFRLMFYLDRKFL